MDWNFFAPASSHMRIASRYRPPLSLEKWLRTSKLRWGNGSTAQSPPPPPPRSDLAEKCPPLACIKSGNWFCIKYKICLSRNRAKKNWYPHFCLRDCFCIAGNWRLATACFAALQFNTSVILRVNLCFAPNLDCCAFEIDSFVDISWVNCTNWGSLAWESIWVCESIMYHFITLVC